MQLEELETEIQQLRSALTSRILFETSRILFEQAKAILTIVLDISVDEAFELMRQTRSSRRLLQEVASEVVDSRGRSVEGWRTVK